MPSNKKFDVFRGSWVIFLLDNSMIFFWVFLTNTYNIIQSTHDESQDKIRMDNKRSIK